MRALGPRWNTRVIVVPGLPLVTTGPYRWMRHPNYLIVLFEGIALPLVHTAWITAMLFTIANTPWLVVRVARRTRCYGLRWDQRRRAVRGAVRRPHRRTPTVRAARLLPAHRRERRPARPPARGPAGCGRPLRAGRTDGAQVGARVSGSRPSLGRKKLERGIGEGPPRIEGSGPRCLSTSSARPAGTEGWRMATTSRDWWTARPDEVHIACPAGLLRPDGPRERRSHMRRLPPARPPVHQGNRRHLRTPCALRLASLPAGPAERHAVRAPRHGGSTPVGGRREYLRASRVGADLFDPC